MSAYWDTLNRVGIRIVTEPSYEQITLQQAYDHLRIDAYGSPLAHPDDDWLEANIATAREWCEFYSGRAMAPQVIELGIGSFPCSDDYYRTWPWGGYGYYPNYPYQTTQAIKLPMSPILGVESVSYFDGDGVLQTLAATSYVVDNYSEPGWLYPAYSTSWPSTYSRPNAVIVRYHAGYTTDSDSPNDFPLPKRYRSAMLLVLAHLYENRENVAAGGAGGTLLHEIPLGAAALLERGRIRLDVA